ncbi:hypothetical protein [Klebsiella quasipneumoniae]|uniref:hypothetical protein n=1 Tax=Klebsiella quasipneumoniae TaxID=1463165 RepID=UPI00387B9103
MRVTGHDQAAIEGAIRQCAPATRQKDEGRDWNDYAQRTARYAYSAAGDRQPPSLGSTASSGRSWKGASLYASRSRPRRRRSSATTHPA